jgi:hypothetical protein
MMGVFKNMVPFAFGFSSPSQFPGEAQEIAEVFYRYITDTIRESGPRAINDDFCIALTQSGGMVMLARHLDPDSIRDLIVVPAWKIAQSIVEWDITAGSATPDTRTYKAFKSLRDWVRALLENGDVPKRRWPRTLADLTTEWMNLHQLELNQGYVNIRRFCEEIVISCQREPRYSVSWDGTLIWKSSEALAEVDGSIRNVSEGGACLLLPQERFVGVPRMITKESKPSVYALTVSTPSGPVTTSSFDLRISEPRSDIGRLPPVPDFCPDVSVVWWRADPAGLVCALRFSSSASPAS